MCKAKEEGFNGIVCPSGGNAGLASAFAARKLGLKAVIVVMNCISDEVVARIRDEKADVIKFGDSSDQTIGEAQRLAKENNYMFVHPFNHEVIWKGHSTLVDEIIEQLNGEQPSLIVTCCGGGGLFSGIMTGLERRKLYTTGVLVMETREASSFNNMVKNNYKPIDVKCNSIAKTLCSINVCLKAAEFAKDDKFLIISKTVTDDEAIKAVLDFANQQRILLEASCATVIAALYNGMVKEVLEEHKNSLSSGPVVLIVCGGCDINVDMIIKWKQQLLIRTKSELVT